MWKVIKVLENHCLIPSHQDRMKSGEPSKATPGEHSQTTGSIQLNNKNDQTMTRDRQLWTTKNTASMALLKHSPLNEPT